MADLTDTVELLPRELEAELQQKFPDADLTALRTRAGVVVMRRVKRTTYKRYRQMLINEKTREEATEWLARAACVHPDNVTLVAWLDEYPGIATPMANKASELAGGGDEDAEEKKLGS